VVRYGRMLKVMKISRGVVFLKPCFNSGNNSGGLSYSLPLKSLAMVKMRRVVTREELKKLLKLGLARPKKNESAGEIKDSLENNHLPETIGVVRRLWLEKKVNLGSLPGGKLNMYRQALEQLTEELAIVRGLSLEKAKVTISSALKTVRE